MSIDLLHHMFKIEPNDEINFIYPTIELNQNIAESTTWYDA